ncbi:LPS-assembly protein LptD [Methylophilaceae bacterium]|nr:LPS-assembly protein LptD [Methylophilaceae bacterium]
MLNSNLIAIATALLMVANETVYAMEEPPAAQQAETSIKEADQTLIAEDERPHLALDAQLGTANAQPELQISGESPRAAIAQDARQSLQLERNLGGVYQSELILDKSMPAEGSIIIEGDSMEVLLDRKMQSIGNASIRKDNQSIYGDRIEYDVQNDELHVVGNTRIEFEGIDIWGPELRMKLYDNVGEMKEPSFRMETQFTNIPQVGMVKATDTLDKESRDFDSTFNNAANSLATQNIEDTASYDATLGRQQGASRGDAKTLFFEGEDKKRLESARYTTCEVDRDDWYIKASELELDNYTKTGTAWNARVEFQGVPLLYTPWINFSFLNQRKTGFLSPTVGTTSRSGFEVLLPFYWNIAPNMDATLGTRYLSKRGTQMQGEFRYLDEHFEGFTSAEYLPSDNNTGENRYFLNLQHRHNLGNGWAAGYNYEKVSDDAYFSELSTRITVTSRVNLPQQGYVNYSDDVWSFSGIVQKYQTLDGISFPYERLPQLTLTGDKDWEMLNARLDTQWVTFDRKKDEPFRLATENNGLLTTGVTGSRFTAYPSITVPFERPYGYITPKFGVHHSNYSLDNEAFTLNGVAGNFESDNRTLPIFSLDSGLYFDRDMQVVNNRYTQTLEPRLYYVYIPYRDQSHIPIFDTAEADLNIASLFTENQFTGNDRVNNANQLSLALTTRMFDARTGQQRLAATLGQRFYFTDQKVVIPGYTPRTSDSSDIIAAVTARLTNDWNIDAAWQYNTDRSTTIKSNIGARFNPEPGKVLNLNYRYTEDRLEQVNISGQWPLGKGWYGMGRWNYSLFENQPIEGLAGIEYDAGCWQARTVLQRVSTATADANYALYFQLELGGLASIGSNPLSLLKRGIPGYTTSGMIPTPYQQYDE